MLLPKKPILTRSAFLFLAGLLLLLVAGSLSIPFSVHHGIATIGDDSVSYLMLAQHFAGSESPFVAQWLGFHAHFPPLFPAVLALSGGANDFQRAHLVVAFFAVLSIIPICAHAARELGRKEAGLLVALLFLLAPTAWISITGILSESLYLFITLSAILYYEIRLAGRRALASRLLFFGVLLAFAWLTRAIGLALVLAYVAHVSLGLVREKGVRDYRQLLPLLSVAILAGAWFLFRPEGNQYQHALGTVARSWLDDPTYVFFASAKFLYRGWIASFSAEAGITWVPSLVFSALGLLGLAGALRRVLANRLDGWYVALSLGIIFFWVFQEENMRRLLYPLLPLLLVYAGQSVTALCRLAGLARHSGKVVVFAATILALLILPASLAVFEKSQDAGPGISGVKHSYAGVTDYYTTINTTHARAIAARQIAVLAGLESLHEATPTGAKIMWLRPEYIALLGKREGVPMYFAWDKQTLAREIRDSKTDFLVVSALYKSDLDGQDGDPLVLLRGIDAYAWPVFGIRNVVTGREEFALWKVDPALLEAALKAN